MRVSLRASPFAKDVGVNETGGFLFITGHEMAATVIRDRHTRMTHLGADGFGVDPCRDEQACIGMSRLVERHPSQPGFPPCRVRPDLDCAIIERCCCRLAEQKPSVRPSLSLCAAWLNALLERLDRSDPPSPYLNVQEAFSVPGSSRRKKDGEGTSLAAGKWNGS